MTFFDGETAPECLANIARAAPDAVTVFPATGDRITRREVDEQATRAARGFLAAGIGPSDIVGVLLPPAREFLTTLFGLWRAGAAVSVLPVPAGFVDDGAISRLNRLISAAGITHVVTDRPHPLNAELVDPHVTGAGRLPSVTPYDLAVVQFTSGSTSAPKGVLLPHRNLVEGMRACVVSGELTSDDVLVQWVPLYHDMGLIGLCTPLLNGSDMHVFSPSAFLRRPAVVLAYFAEHRGTLFAGPNFAYDHLLDALCPEQVAALDLSSWRIAYNGAEPVSAATVRRFHDVLAPGGVREDVMLPVYGMAEATLSISYPPLGQRPRVVVVDRDELAATGRVREVATSHRSAKELVSVGRAVHGLRLDCPQGSLGEIRVAGKGLCTGYLRDPRSTRELFDGQWMRTGDLGFRLDGDLFVAGRRKEMVIVHGQNFFPDDVEAIARDVPGVHKGRCAAYADEDEHIAVVVEWDGKTAPEEEMRRKVAQRVAEGMGFHRVRVHVVKPRWLTRTTSGKLQRALARQRLNGGI